MIYGSCLCGEIEFCANEIETMTFNCHCNRCKKSHGSAFSTQVLADKKSLHFIKGENYLSEYKQVGAIRTFCSECGSRLMNYSQDESYLSISIGSLKDSARFFPIGECFIGEKSPFVELNNSIAHYEKLPG